MSLVGSFLGTDQAAASKAAAADTYAKQQAATGAITDYGNDYASQFAKLGQGYQPFVNTGVNANTQLNNLIADPSSVASMPGYQFDLEQGLNGVDHGASARGMLNSGRNIKDETRFATGLADNTLSQQFSRLQGAANGGQAALGAQNTTIGTGLGGQLATRQSAYQGNMNAAGTIGQGNVAAANAEGQGAANVVGLGLNLAKLGVGAYTGGGFGGGGSVSSANYGDGVYRPMYN